MKHRYDILDHLYEKKVKNPKSHVATLCRPLAECECTFHVMPLPPLLALSVPLSVARSGDRLAQHIFQEAGAALGAHVKALAPKVEDALCTESGGLHIVVVGSVLTFCWDLLKEGTEILPPSL